MRFLEKEYNRLQMKCESISNLYSFSASFLHEVTNRLFRLKNMDEKLIRDEVDSLCEMLVWQFRNVQTSCVPLQSVLNAKYQSLLNSRICLKLDMKFVEFDCVEGLRDYEFFDVLISYAINVCAEDIPFLHLKSDYINECVVIKLNCSGKVKDEILVELSKYVPQNTKMSYEYKNNASELTIIFAGVCL